MNPEFERNLWLEFSVSRAAVMPLVIGLVLGLASLGGSAKSIADTALATFFVVAVVWGAFKAARTVTDEVRDRTWDGQRMSGLSPIAMTLGKLFGATIFCWYGAAIALAAFIAARLVSPADSNLPLWIEVLRVILTAALAHAVAFAASLAGARRRRGQARIDSFLFFLAGLGAYYAAESASGVWNVVSNVVDEVGAGRPPIVWWGTSFDGGPFAIVSTALFVALAILTSWRLMRVELQAPAQPIAYVLIAASGVLWFAGFGEAPVDRAIAATSAFIAITWATAWIEPKDVVAWRALARGGAASLWPAAPLGLAMTAVAALTTAGLILVNGPTKDIGSAFAPLALVAFLLRDMTIFAFFHLGERARRADFSAVLTIVLLYVLAPGFLSGMAGSDAIRAVFMPDPSGAMTLHIVSLVSALAQAGAFAAAALARLRARAAGLAPQPTSGWRARGA
ncbi:MAG: hypothetical protein ACOYM8_05440 [Caulobacterales bacterium]|jgi:hypothetical protein